MRRKYAFTLIELLVATAIFSIVVLSMYSAFQTGLLSYNRMDSAFNVYQEARVILNRMELDLTNSFIYNSSDSAFKGNKDNLRFLSVVDTYSSGQMNPDACRVQYELKDESLQRAITKGALLLQGNVTVAAEEFSSNVKEFSLAYAYPVANADKPYDWQEAWPATDDAAKQAAQAKALPIAVKIKLRLIERDRHRGELGLIEFNKTISLPLGDNNVTATPP